VGLAALLHTSAIAFQTLKYLGVAYLLYLAWRTLREQGGLRVESDDASRSSAEVIVWAIAINVLNPKLSIFASCSTSPASRRSSASRLVERRHWPASALR